MVYVYRKEDLIVEVYIEKTKEYGYVVQYKANRTNIEDSPYIAEVLFESILRFAIQTQINPN